MVNLDMGRQQGNTIHLHTEKPISESDEASDLWHKFDCRRMQLSRAVDYHQLLSARVKGLMEMLLDQCDISGDVRSVLILRKLDRDLFRIIGVCR